MSVHDPGVAHGSAGPGPVTMAHFDAFAAFVTTPHSRFTWVARATGTTPGISVATHAGNGAAGLWRLLADAGGTPVGRVGFWHPIWLDEPELSWVIYEGHTRRGFAVEAAGAALRWWYGQGARRPHEPDCTRQSRLGRGGAPAWGAARRAARLCQWQCRGPLAPHRCGMTIVTERLVLRLPQDDDLPAMAAFSISPRAIYVGGSQVADRFAAWRTLMSGRGHGPPMALAIGRWIAMACLVGRVGVIYPDGWAEPELAWHLYDGFEGRGYATEAAKAARADYHRRISLARAHQLHPPGQCRIAGGGAAAGAVIETALDYPEPDPSDLWRHPAPGRADDGGAENRASDPAGLAAGGFRCLCRAACRAARALHVGPVARSGLGPVPCAGREWRLRGRGMWVIDRDGAFAGHAGLYQCWDDAEPDLGWALIAAAEGQGLAFEALTAIRAHLAPRLGPDPTGEPYRCAKPPLAGAGAAHGCAERARDVHAPDAVETIWRHPEWAA